MRIMSRRTFQGSARFARMCDSGQRTPHSSQQSPHAHLSSGRSRISGLIHFFLFSISAFSYSFTGTVLFTRLVVLLSGDAMWETTTTRENLFIRAPCEG